MIKATTQRAMITKTVLLRLKTRRNAMGLLIAKYLSMLIAVIVKTEAATATPTKFRKRILTYRGWKCWNTG